MTDDWTCEKLMDAAPQYFDAGKAAGIDARIGIRLLGNGGGEWSFIISDGLMQVQRGLAHPLDGLMQAAADDWVKLHTGELDGSQAYRQGRLRMQGNVKVLQLIGELFEHPAQR